MSLILTRAPSLAFPAGRSCGFDPTHPASANRVTDGPLLSCVATGSNFIAFASGPLVRGTLSGSPTAVIGNIVGPGLQFSGTQNVSFPFPSSAVQASFTCAAIFQVNAASVTQGIVFTNSTGNSIRITAANIFAIKVGTGTVITTNTTAVHGDSYFFAYSSTGVNTGAQAYAITNLTTGQITTGTPAANANGLGAQTSLIIGNVAISTGPFLAPIACAMYANSFLSVQVLQMWAADPWSFWYPHFRMPSVNLELVGVTAAAFKAAWAMNRNFINEGVAT